MMEKILSRPVPEHMARRSNAASKFFTSAPSGGYELRWDPSAPEAKYTNQNCRPLHKYSRVVGTSQRSTETKMYDLLLRMTEYDPVLRITLRETMRHEYFDNDQNLAVAHILRLQI